MQAFRRVPLKNLRVTAVRFIARHSLTQNLFKELERKQVWGPTDATGGSSLETPWDKFIRHLRDTLHLAQHNLRITLR